jgi:FkbM family methyltransferase
MSMSNILQFEEFICYGAGDAFHWVEEVLEKRFGAKVRAIIDRRGNHISGDFYCPIWNPDSVEQFISIAKVNNNIPVVLALGSENACISVNAILKNLGFRKIFSLNEIYQTHLGFQLDDLQSEQLQIQLIEEREEISYSRSLLADKLSQKVFNQLLDIYVKKQGSWIDYLPNSKCHFPSELHKFIDYSCVVQCGVAPDELQILLGQKLHPIRELICFEPDPIIYQGYDSVPGLNEHVFERSELNLATQLVIYPMALHSSLGHQFFLSAGSSEHHGVRKVHRKNSFGSRLSADGKCLVKTTSLDTALLGHHPTFIAVDAEGAELDILEGASSIIDTFRPSLMIAVYHRMNHLWQVIRLLRQRHKSYRFYLRNYTGFSYETFLYAIPEEHLGHN